jgi:hypothetical protein
MMSSQRKQPALPQISVRLTTATKDEFLTYSSRLELDHSDIAKLLIIREKWLRRLVKLAADGKVPVRARQVRGKAVPMPHVTVYLPSLQFTEEFASYAASCGLKRTDALAWLLQAEIAEQWLARALQTE